MLTILIARGVAGMGSGGILTVTVRSCPLSTSDLPVLHLLPPLYIARHPH